MRDSMARTSTSIMDTHRLRFTTARLIGTTATGILQSITQFLIQRHRFPRIMVLAVITMIDLQPLYQERLITSSFMSKVHSPGEETFDGRFGNGGTYVINWLMDPVRSMDPKRWLGDPTREDQSDYKELYQPRVIGSEKICRR